MTVKAETNPWTRKKQFRALCTHPASIWTDLKWQVVLKVKLGTYLLIAVHLHHSQLCPLEIADTSCRHRETCLSFPVICTCRGCNPPQRLPLCLVLSQSYSFEVLGIPTERYLAMKK